MSGKNNKVPKLRFPEFRDAGAWENRELGEFISERSEHPEDKLPLYSLTIEDGVTPKTERYERSFLVKNKKKAYKLVCPDDFAFNPMNLRFGAIARHSGTKKVALSKYYNIFYCNKTVDSTFCSIYFRSGGMMMHYDNMAIGSLIEKRRVHFKDFLRFNICFPCLSEQQKIADCLSSLDDLITTQAQKLDILKSHKKGLMQQLFPAEGETVPKLRFPEFRDAGAWEEKMLGEICEVNPKTSNLPQEFIYIDLESVISGSLTKEVNIQKNGAPSRAQRLLKLGDVLFQMVRPYQKNNYFFDKQGDYVASTGYAQLRATGSAKFLYQIIHTYAFVNKVLARCTGTSYPAINSSDLEKVYFSIPSLPEQRKIADFLSSIDGLIAAQTQKLDALKTHQKGLMQQLFPAADEVGV